jgi:hypothetical protein
MALPNRGLQVTRFAAGNRACARVPSPLRGSARLKLSLGGLEALERDLR